MKKIRTLVPREKNWIKQIYMKGKEIARPLILEK